MHKKLMTLFFVLSMAFSISACGSKSIDNTSNEADTETEASEESAIVKGDMSLLDFECDKYITLGEYSGMTADYVIPGITDEDLTEEARNIIYDYVDYIDKSTGAEYEDELTINFKGTMNGEEFEGGSGEGYTFELGAGEFLEEFEEPLYGAKKGDTVVAKFDFPEDYGDLGGQAVEFTIEVLELKEAVYPEYTDEFITENTEYSSIKDYESAKLSELRKEYEDTAMSQTREEVMAAALANAQFKTVPEDLLAYCYESTYSTFESYAEMFGMEMDEFIANFIGDSEDAVMNDATSWAKEIVFMKAVGEKENIDFEAVYSVKAEEMAREYGFDSADAFESEYGKFDIFVNIMRDAVIDKLMETAVLNEISEEEYYSQYYDDYEDEYDIEDEDFFDEDSSEVDADELFDEEDLEVDSEE